MTHVPAANLAQLQEVARRFQETVRARDEAESARLASEEGRAALEAELAALRAEIAAIESRQPANARTVTITARRRPATFISTCFCARPVSTRQAPDTVEVEVAGMPNETARALSIMCCGATTASRSRSSRPSARARTPASASSRPSSTPIAWKRQFGQRPVIFYTNGYEHWLWDDARYPPRPMQGFLKHDELELLIQRRTTTKPLAPTRTSTARSSSASYQHRAIRRVAEAFEKDHQRKALLVMATGAGKTRTVIALCDLLMRANWAKRVAVPRRPRRAGEPGGQGVQETPAIADRSISSPTRQQRRAGSMSRPIRP